jgi:transcriptional regulator with XRE-family HTH domain
LDASLTKRPESLWLVDAEYHPSENHTSVYGNHRLSHPRHETDFNATYRWLAVLLAGHFQSRGWSVADLNRALGKAASHPTAFRWLRGEALPSTQNLLALSRRLGVPKAALQSEASRRQCSRRLPPALALKRRRLLMAAMVALGNAGEEAVALDGDSRPVSPRARSAFFTVDNRKIINPYGDVFVPKGINCEGVDQGWSPGLNAVVKNLRTGAPLTTTFPGVNFVRVNLYGVESAARLAPYINCLTGLGIVCELEYHPYGTENILTGSALNAVCQWYTGLASAFIRNPYVFFGTQNEPAGNETGQIVAIYNAVRRTGNNTVILMCPHGGSNTTGIHANALAPLSGVGWDLHYYNWISQYSTHVQTNQAALMQAINAVRAAKDVPVMIGEFGDSTNGSSIDRGWQATVQVCLANPGGFAAFYWNKNSNTGDCLLASPYDGSALTQYGQMVQNAI